MALGCLLPSTPCGRIDWGLDVALAVVGPTRRRRGHDRSRPRGLRLHIAFRGYGIDGLPSARRAVALNVGHYSTDPALGVAGSGSVAAHSAGGHATGRHDHADALVDGARSERLRYVAARHDFRAS